MMLKLISLLTGRKIVWLEDFEGETYRTLERKTPFGKRAYVYWFTRVGDIILNEDGTTGGSAIFVKKWSYEK